MEDLSKWNKQVKLFLQVVDETLVRDVDENQADVDQISVDVEPELVAEQEPGLQGEVEQAEPQGEVEHEEPEDVPEADPEESELSTLKKKVHNLQKMNWRLRHQKEELRDTMQRRINALEVTLDEFSLY